MNKKYVKLSDLKEGECCLIKEFSGNNDSDAVKLMVDKGILYGEKLKLIYIAPFKGQYMVLFMNDYISFDDYTADNIIVERCENIDNKNSLESYNINDVYKDNLKKSFCRGFCSSCNKRLCFKKINDKQNIRIKALLIGNPNCGKTTLFNLLTGSNERTGNYAGVTVEAKQGYCYFENYELDIYDLPGIYSMNVTSEDEKCTVDFINNNYFDIIINVVNSLLIRRSLFLTEQIKKIVESRNKKIICAFNFYDKFIDEGYFINLNKFEKNFNIITIPIATGRCFGINNLLEKITSLFKKD